MPSSFVFCLFEGEITLENLLHMALTSAQKETADFSFKPVAAPRDGQQEVESIIICKIPEADWFRGKYLLGYHLVGWKGRRHENHLERQ
ncbi:hypothetical protein BgiMline_007022 [Biomphalaria glabrata]